MYFIFLSHSLQHLIESLWYAVLETFILLAAFHQELNFSFVTIVMTLFVVKSFHWLANDRIDFVSSFLHNIMGALLLRVGAHLHTKVISSLVQARKLLLIQECMKCIRESSC